MPLIIPVYKKVTPKKSGKQPWKTTLENNLGKQHKKKLEKRGNQKKVSQEIKKNSKKPF
ncbi:hypothetical protein L1994_01020 [Methanomicrobium antiquum]|uniref:Uncharacterized protein n=1 Tax=Methanomicrobium antiquum TaxID=487686 RepID=A0AAF0FR22_9EURY|nr:hypothetical protein [Methanomicrobium antiquum]WFN37007.1 hypothetical protein L1994_01020 [Methanomicrobium antiquum]